MESEPQTRWQLSGELLGGVTPVSSSGAGSQRAVCGQPCGHRLQLRGTGRRLRHGRVHGGVGHAGAAAALLHGAARVPGSTAHVFMGLGH